VCRLCRFFNPRVSDACDEPVAAPVIDKDRANFCEYFQARKGAYLAQDDAVVRAAHDQLTTLFGAPPGERRDGDTHDPSGDARGRLDDLFKK
jgi:hypothetical protein